MLIRILGFWLFMGLSTTVLAQNTYQLKGLVIDSQDLHAIEGVNIVGTGKYAITASTGEFTIKNLAEGQYTFTISHIAYITKKVTVTVGPNKETVVTFSLEEATTELDEVAVSGISKRQMNQETPTVSYSVSKEFLEQNRENSLMQTLRKLPGVSTITIGSGQSKPVIRGLGFNRVAVVQNGVKHEAQQWGNDHGLEIDQYGIENIRLIKGPASLLYGSDAIAGVVDIQQPNVPFQNSFGGEVNLVGESNNDLIGVSAGVQGRKEEWYYRGRLTYRDYADYKVPTDQINYENYIFELHDNNLRNTAGQEADASFSVGYLGENLRSETTFSNVNAKNGFFANAHGLEVRTSDIDYDRSSRDVDLPYHKVNHIKITNNTTWIRGDHSFHVDLGYQNNNREELSEPVPHGYMPTPPDSLERIFNKNTYALNARDAFNIWDDHDMVVGVNLEYQDNNIGGWGFLIPEYNRFSAGAFAYDQFELLPGLHLMAGLRYDYGFMQTKAYYDWFRTPINNPDGSTSYVYVQRALDKNLHFGSFSASVGLSYIQDNTTYKVNLGKSFRMPLANELASDGVNYHMYRYERGNLDLDPEASYQLDVEVDHDSGNFRFGVSPFVNYFTNYIYLNPTPNYYETLQIYEYTQSEVFRVGGELSVGATLMEDLRLDASLEYVYSRQMSGPKKGFTIPFSPPLSTLVSASYQFGDFLFLDSPQLVADYRITAAQNEIVPPEDKTAGYQVLNLSFMTEVDGFREDSPIAIRFKLNNVFNTQYFDHTSFYRLIDVPEPGRNVALSLTIPF